MSQAFDRNLMHKERCAKPEPDQRQSPDALMSRDVEHLSGDLSLCTLDLGEGPFLPPRISSAPGSFLPCSVEREKLQSGSQISLP